MTTNPRESRETELRKLTISQLKSIAKIPSRLKRKDDIVVYLLNVDVGEDEANKRPRLAPLFVNTSVAKSVDCELCVGKGTVWCELGLARCPICRPASNRLVTSPPLVKYECTHNGPYSDIVDTDPETGELMLRMEGVPNPSILTSLVSVYGYGMCESIEALLDTDGMLEHAVEKLIERTRNSAENYSIAQAQLNSEEARDTARTRSVCERKTGRERVVEDWGVLEGLDEKFCKEYFGVMAWIESDPSKYAVLVYDYLVLKRDSIKWFKNCAHVYFEICEREGLAGETMEGFEEYFKTQVIRVQEAVFSLPASGGAIPDIFRDSSMPIHEDDEIEMLSLASPSGNAEVLIIDD